MSFAIDVADIFEAADITPLGLALSVGASALYNKASGADAQATTAAADAATAATQATAASAGTGAIQAKLGDATGLPMGTLAGGITQILSDLVVDTGDILNGFNYLFTGTDNANFSVGHGDTNVLSLLNGISGVVDVVELALEIAGVVPRWAPLFRLSGPSAGLVLGDSRLLGPKPSVLNIRSTDTVLSWLNREASAYTWAAGTAPDTIEAPDTIYASAIWSCLLTPDVFDYLQHYMYTPSSGLPKRSSFGDLNLILSLLPVQY